MTSPSSAPSPDRGQHFLAAAAVLYMIGATAWAVPGDSWLPRVVRRNFSDVFTAVGLWQNWNMFAPVPKHVDEWLAARVEFGDGVVVQWPLTLDRDLGWWERCRKDRWRKYFGDDFTKPRMEPAWDPACRWLAATVARSQARGVEEVIQVELVRHSRPCLLPPQGWGGWTRALESRPYGRKVFHTWRAGTIR